MDSVLQRSYQRNMIWGNLVCIVLAAGAGLFIALGGTGGNGVLPNTHHRGARNGSPTASVPDQTGFGDREVGRKGFGGFGARWTIVRDPSRPKVSAHTPPNMHTHIDATSLSPVITGLDLASGTTWGIGGETGDCSVPDYGIPRVDYTPTPVWKSLPADYHAHQTRPARDRPIRIRMAAVCYPPKADKLHCDGIARVRVGIGAEGELTHCDLLGESPPNLGFGDELMRALQKSKYEPAIVRGRRTASSVDVTFQFVWRDAVKPDIQTSDNVQLVYRPR